MQLIYFSDLVFSALLKPLLFSVVFYRLLNIFYNIIISPEKKEFYSFLSITQLSIIFLPYYTC